MANTIERFKTIMIVIIAVIIVSTTIFLFYSNAVDSAAFKNGNRKFTLAKFEKLPHTKFAYVYYVGGKKYMLSKQIHNYDNKWFVIEYLESDPYNCRLLNDSVVTNDTIQPPVNGWDQLPGYVCH